MNTREQFWFEYYSRVIESGNPWLDYSNERVQVQTFGLAVEAAGPVRDRRCLDVGCGWGRFARTLSALGGTVTAVDIVPELIAEHAAAHPDITWECGSIEDPVLVGRLGSYDLAFLLEVLQLVPIADTLRVVWERLLPGGRMIGMVPNAHCPIVRGTHERLDSNYTAPALEDIDSVLRALPGLERVRYRGLWFGDDQTLVPYEVSSWRSTGSGWESEPNRIQFVALKRDARVR